MFLSSALQIITAIPEFIIALVTSLAGYITSGVIMAAIWAWEHEHNRNLSWRAAKWVLLCFLFVSCFSVWYSFRPGLRAVIETKNIGNLTGYKNPIVLLVVQVRNTGNPSIATRWRLSIFTPDHKCHDGQSEFIQVPISTTSKSGTTLTYSPSDALYQKAVRQPIPQGGLLTGILLYTFSDIDLSTLQRVDDNFKLTFEDVSGKVFTATDLAKNTGSDHYIHPGLGQ